MPTAEMPLVKMGVREGREWPAFQPVSVIPGYPTFSSLVWDRTVFTGDSTSFYDYRMRPACVG